MIWLRITLVIGKYPFAVRSVNKLKAISNREYNFSHHLKYELYCMKLTWN
jgi:hypothetical protein